MFFLLLNEAAHPGLVLVAMLPSREGISLLLEIGVVCAKAFDQQLVLRVDVEV